MVSLVRLSTADLFSVTEGAPFTQLPPQCAQPLRAALHCHLQCTGCLLPADFLWHKTCPSFDASSVEVWVLRLIFDQCLFVMFILHV